MKKIILAAGLTLMVAQPAQALTQYLVSQWTNNGSTFCKYANGTVLNVGYKLCPLSIEG